MSTYSGMTTTAQSCPGGAVDSSNNFHVVWFGYATGYTSYRQIWEADYNGTWSTIVRISTYTGMDTNNLLYPAITVDSSNNLDVVWRGNAAGYAYSEMWFSKRTGTSWSTPIVLSTYDGMSSANQISPALAIDSDNYLYATWLGTATGYSNTQIWVALYNGTWRTPVIVSTYTGMTSYAQEEPAIAVDTENRVYVFWDGMATGYTDYNKVWCAIYNGIWNAPQVLQAVGQNKYPTVEWSNYPSFNIPSTQINYMFTVGTASPYNVTFSCLNLPVNHATLHLLLTEDPSQATYAEGQSVTLTVDVLNQLNPSLKSALTLTVTGPGNYYYFDFQTINVTANSVGEYSFTWNVPAVAGTYVVEAGLVPPRLTAYDAAWLEVV
jgi:hypothetical protein